MSKILEIVDSLENIGIVPVVKLENTQNAVKLAKALRDGGINCAEVTFRAKGAAQVIKDMTTAFPDMLVGAGTVLTTAQAQEAIDAGSKFLVAPGLNPKVVTYTLSKGVPFMPGISSSSEMEQAIELNLPAVKFFPAEQAGGLDYIKAISAPYSDMRFMPTGGVNENNLLTYLAFNKIFACGGSWMVSNDLVSNERWDDIAATCRKAVNKMLGFELAHVGINSQSEDSALGIAKLFSDAFGFETKNGNSSVFASSAIEINKSDPKTCAAHIAISTNSIKRAVYALKTRGFEVNPDSYKYDKAGKAIAVYLKANFGNIAVHLLQK